MTPRQYEQRVRAEGAATTREVILAATVALAQELERIDFTLDQVAARAHRSVQTILRQFGSRDGLIEAAIQRGMSEVVEERRPVDGDIRASIERLVAHYDRRGRFVLSLLAMNEDHEAPQVTGPGKLVHRAWIEQVFATPLERSRDAAALTDMLVVATDVFAWKLLRLDRGLSASIVVARMAAMTSAIVEGDRS